MIVIPTGTTIQSHHQPSFQVMENLINSWLFYSDIVELFILVIYNCKEKKNLYIILFLDIFELRKLSVLGKSFKKKLNSFRILDLNYEILLSVY